jgi:signal transduction histidine kinase
MADMKSILEDFLSLGKLEEGLIKTNVEELSSDQLFDEIKNIVTGMESLCKKGQHNSLNQSGKTSVHIDKMLFKNILVNLIANAIKFSSENAVIEIDSELAEEYLQVSVKDQGIGITEEDQQHLFERFFRAKNAVNIQGTGLGLHIISKYLELMNGYIDLKSKLNDGSVFTFTIPQ